MQPYDTPILFIIFNRYRTTREVFEAIRAVRPRRLYIAADGPRNEQEHTKCEEARSIIAQVDWECDVKLLLHEKNLGCKYNIYTAISWFFEHETEGIILEDDCMPDASFFPFMEQMLIKYRDDQRIGMIAGHTEVDIPLETSYVFSRFSSCWGWATWRRAWQNIDLELVNYDYKKDVTPLMVYDQRRTKHWDVVLYSIENNLVNTWDWQWNYSMAAQSQLCVIPTKNLVSNIGFGPDGTHCLGEAPSEVLTRYSLTFPLVEPKTMLINWAYEQEHERKIFTMGMEPDRPHKKKGLLSRTARHIRTFLKRFR